jgi:tetratricopeptide (TPR) repeat protein
VLTKSRSGYAAAAVGLVLAVWLCRRRSGRIGWKLPLGVAAAAAVLLGAAWAAGGLDRQVFTEASKSLGYRGQYWQSTMRMIADRPLVGCGPGNFKSAYTRYKLPEASEEIADPHNFLLEVWATAGTPAVLALVALLGVFAWRIVRAEQARSNPIHRVEEDRTNAVTTNGPEQPGFVAAGGIAGLVLAVPLGMVTAAPPGLAVLWLGLPAAAAAGGLLWPWIQRGRLPAALPAVGAAVLLVNLLAAGGIGFPGVAGTLWLLLAVGLNAAEPEPSQTVPRLAGAAAAVFVLAMGVSCYTTAYGPVMVARGRVQAALRDPARAGQHLLEAAEADPLGAEPWKQVAALLFARWQEEPDKELLDNFEKCVDAAASLEPNSAATHFQIGRWYDLAFRQAGEKSELDKAIEAYRRAVELYPTRTLYRARLALALKAAGDGPGSEEQAAEALRLDALTPHKDKKLPAELRQKLERK